VADRTLARVTHRDFRPENDDCRRTILRITLLVPPTEGEVYDYLPETMIGRVRNLPSFAGVLAFD
jgi:hypothetical protein